MIVGQSVSDDAVLTFSSQVDTLPAAAVQRVQPRDIWRSFDNSDQWLVFDLGPDITFNSVAVLYHNVPPSLATWRVRTAATEAALTSAPVYDSGNLSISGPAAPYVYENKFTRKHGVDFFTAAELRWCRIDFNTLTKVTQLDVGRIMIMNASQQSPAYGWQYSAAVDTEPIVTAGGVWTRTNRNYRTLSLTYPGLTDVGAYDDHSQYELDLSRPVCVSITEGQTAKERETDWTLYGVISGVSNTYLFKDINARTYQIEEMERP